MASAWTTKLSIGHVQGRTLAVQASAVATSPGGPPDTHRHGSWNGNSTPPPPPPPATARSGTYQLPRGTNAGAPLRHRHPKQTQHGPADVSQSNLVKGTPRRHVATKRPSNASEVQVQQQAKQQRLLQSIPVEEHPAALRDLQSRFLTEDLLAASSLAALASCLPNASLDSLNAIHVTAAYRRLAQLRKGRHIPSMSPHEQQCLASLHRKLDALALKHCHFMRPRELSGVLWAAASSGHALGPVLLDTLMERLLHQFGACNEIDVSNVVWALVTHLRSAASQATEDLPAWRATLGPEELSPWKVPGLGNSSHPIEGATKGGYFEALSSPPQISMPGPRSNAPASEATSPPAPSIQHLSSTDSASDPASNPASSLVNPALEATKPLAPEAPAAPGTAATAAVAAPSSCVLPPTPCLQHNHHQQQQQQQIGQAYSDSMQAVQAAVTNGIAPGVATQAAAAAGDDDGDGDDDPACNPRSVPLDTNTTDTTSAAHTPPSHTHPNHTNTTSTTTTTTAASLQRLPPLSFARQTAPVTLQRPPPRILVNTQPGAEQQQLPKAAFGATSSASAEQQQLPNAAFRAPPSAGASFSSKGIPSKIAEPLHRSGIQPNGRVVSPISSNSSGGSFVPVLSAPAPLPPPTAHFTLYPPATPGILPTAPQQQLPWQPLNSSSPTSPAAAAPQVMGGDHCPSDAHPHIRSAGPPAPASMSPAKTPPFLQGHSQRASRPPTSAWMPSASAPSAAPSLLTLQVHEGDPQFNPPLPTPPLHGSSTEAAAGQAAPGQGAMEQAAEGQQGSGFPSLPQDRGPLPSLPPHLSTPEYAPHQQYHAGPHQQHHAGPHQPHPARSQHHTGPNHRAAPHQHHHVDPQRHTGPRHEHHAGPTQATSTDPTAPAHHTHQHEQVAASSLSNALHTLPTPSASTQLHAQGMPHHLHPCSPQPLTATLPSPAHIATTASLAASPPFQTTALPPSPPSSSSTVTTAAAAAAAGPAAMAAPAATSASATTNAPALSLHPSAGRTTLPVEPPSVPGSQHHSRIPDGITDSRHQAIMPTPPTASRSPNLPSSRSWLSTLVHQVLCRLPTLPERPLVVVCNSLVKIPYALSPAQARAVMAHLLSRAHYFRAQDLANMLSSMARLSFRPSESQMQDIAMLVADRLPNFKGDEIALVLHAFVRLRYLPPVRLLQDICRATSGQLSKCSVGHLALMTWAFSQLHWRPPGQWVELVVMEACEREQELQEQELATLLYGLVTFCYKPEQPEMAVLVARMGYLIERGRASPWQLTAYVTALVRLRQRVVPRIAKATLRACYLMLPRFTNVGLAYMLWAVARLAVWRDDSKKRARVSKLLWNVPPDWLAAVCNEVWSRLPSMCAVSAPLILWALAKLHSCMHRPSPAWMGQFWQVAVRLLPHMQPRGVVALLQSSVWLRYTPKSSILQEVSLFVSIHDCHLPKGMHTHVRMLMHRMNKLRAQKHWAFQMKARGLLPPYSLLTALRAKRRMLKRVDSQALQSQHKMRLLAGLQQPRGNQQQHVLKQQQQQQEHLQRQHRGLQERRQQVQLVQATEHQGGLQEQWGGLQGEQRQQQKRRSQFQKTKMLQGRQERQQAVVVREAHAALKDLVAQVQQHLQRDQEQRLLLAQLASGARQEHQQQAHQQLRQHRHAQRKQQKQQQHAQHQLEQQQRRQQRERPVLLRQVTASLAEVSVLLVTLQEQNREQQRGQGRGLSEQQQQEQAQGLQEQQQRRQDGVDFALASLRSTMAALKDQRGTGPKLEQGSVEQLAALVPGMHRAMDHLRAGQA